MSHSRQFEQNQTVTTISYQAIVRPVIQTAATAVSVGLVLYPFDYLRIRRQLPGMPLPGFFSQGLSRALAQSALKNVAIAQKDAVYKHVDGALTEKTEDRQTSNKFAVTIITSAAIGLMDTAFTNYYCNWRILLANRQKPVLANLYERVQFGMLAFNIRYARNITSAFFCVGASSLCKEPLTKLLPTNQAYLSCIVSNIFFGSIAGVLTNCMAVMNVRQVVSMNIKTKAVPSVWNVTKKIFNEEGMRAFTKGSSLSVACTILSYLTIEGVNQSMDYLFVLSQQERDQRLVGNCKMFTSVSKPTPSTSNEKELEAKALPYIPKN